MSLMQALGVHADALILRSRRSEILASNLANADTPGYKARDIDFDSILQRRLDAAAPVRVTHANHLTAGSSRYFGGELKYRQPLQPSLDGNTVDSQVERAEFMTNAIKYQATLGFLDQRIAGLRLALRGE